MASAIQRLRRGVRLRTEPLRASGTPRDEPEPPRGTRSSFHPAVGPKRDACPRGKTRRERVVRSRSQQLFLSAPAALATTARDPPRAAAAAGRPAAACPPGTRSRDVFLLAEG